MFEIHKPQRSGKPLATMVTAGALLLVSMGLAATVVRARGLAAPVHVDGWAITFQPPRGWQSDGSEASGDASEVVFRERASRGNGRRLTMARRQMTAHQTAAEVCFQRAYQLLGGTNPFLIFQMYGRPEVADLGPLPGARLIVPHGAIIHVGALPQGGGPQEAYVFELVSDQPLQPRDLRLADRLLRAIRLVP
ncbi:MAG: hypothetical protein IID40_11860 [Planctomycetes bacterium]|nr:hypothetical protein [Planctomycetota bacterium]